MSLKEAMKIKKTKKLPTKYIRKVWEINPKTRISPNKKNIIRPLRDEDIDFETCEFCSGKGYINEKLCEYCFGTGLIDKELIFKFS